MPIQKQALLYILRHENYGQQKNMMRL